MSGWTGSYKDPANLPSHRLQFLTSVKDGGISAMRLIRPVWFMCSMIHVVRWCPESDDCLSEASRALAPEAVNGGKEK